jgi:hypothetical protein
MKQMQNQAPGRLAGYSTKNHTLHQTRMKPALTSSQVVGEQVRVVETDGEANGLDPG